MLTGLTSSWRVWYGSLATGCAAVELLTELTSAVVVDVVVVLAMKRAVDMVLITMLITLRDTRRGGKHVSQSRMVLLRCKSGGTADDRVDRQQRSLTRN